MTYTNKEIFDSAMSLLSLDGDGSGNTDFCNRAPYIIAIFCSDASELDAIYRRAFGLEAAEPFDGIYLPLSSDFPLSARFVPAAAAYTAAMLILEENSDLAESFFTSYTNMIEGIVKSLPAQNTPTIDKYGF